MLGFLNSKECLIIIGFVYLISTGANDIMKQNKSKPNIAIEIEGNAGSCYGKVTKDYQEFKKGSHVQLIPELCINGNTAGYLKYSSRDGYKAVGLGATREKSNLAEAGKITSIFPNHLYTERGSKYKNNPLTNGVGLTCLGRIALIDANAEVRACK